MGGVVGLSTGIILVLLTSLSNLFMFSIHSYECTSSWPVVTESRLTVVVVVYSVLRLWTTQSCSHWLKTYSNRFLFKVITLRVTPCVYLLHSPLEKDTIGHYIQSPFSTNTSPQEQDQNSGSPWRIYCIFVACSPWSMHCIKWLLFDALPEIQYEPLLKFSVASLTFCMMLLLELNNMKPLLNL